MDSPLQAGEILENSLPSKNQIKKQLKRQRWLDSRTSRRKLEREKRKLQRQELSQRLTREDPDGILPTRPAKTRFKLMANSSNKFRVVIDMNFEDYMTEQEIGKAVQQVGRIYSINRHCENPCQLYITSLKGKILDKFVITNAGYLNWDINHTELHYTSLFPEDSFDNSSDSKNLNKVNEARALIDQSTSNFIYLTGDSDETLPSVDSIIKDESKIFVIGGLVDHNRHKGLCQKLALARNIKTAKLPIKENVTLTQRHILSTVAVFEIMLQVLGSHKQWKDALTSSIPKRKLAEPKAIRTDAENSNQQRQQQRLPTVGDDDVVIGGGVD